MKSFGAMCLLVAAAMFGVAPPQPLPQVERVAYVVEVDPRARAASWTFEHLTLANTRGKAVRTAHFAVDPTQDPLSRATLQDYEHSGYDIGHLPAARNYGSQLAQNATFCLGSAAPQNPALNRGLWSKLEETVFDLVDAMTEVDVWTGTLFVPDKHGVITIPTIGEHGVWVSTHWSKAILIYKDGEPTECRAWCIPNEAPADSKDLDRWRVPTDRIEFLIGRDLFADLDDQLEKKLEAAK